MAVAFDAVTGDTTNTNGRGVIWTMGDIGIRVATGTTNGVGVLIENGTGQVCQVYFVWDE